MKSVQGSGKNGVIVLGGHVQALGIVRTFGEQGISSIIIDKTKNNIARHSRYCSMFFQVSDEKLIGFLLNLGARAKFLNWLIFPTNDFHLKVLSTNKPELQKYFKVAADNWNVVKTFYNKIETYKLAAELNIPLAGTFYPSDECDLERLGCKFPCIIKPAVMFDFYKKAKRKVFICRTDKELIKYYRIATSLIPSEEIIIQDIIEGPSKNQFSACFLYLNGETHVSLTACRMRQHPIDFGNATTYAETVDLPLLIKYGEKILNAVNYNGVCEVEFKLDDRDGEYKFLEVNPRTWKWHTIANKAGTPFLMNLYAFKMNVPPLPFKKQNEASFRHALTDIPIQFMLLIRGHSYAFRIKHPVTNAVWLWDDIRPWFYEKLYFLFLLRNR
jgi:predicted ATP-grasp superfamily ATP-dependent carboligase